MSHTRWLRCPACLKGSVIEGRALYPSPKPLRVPQGLPEVDGLIWDEVRICLGGGANAAAVMLCRKLLFHVAVAHGLAPKKSNGRAPTFTEAVRHLHSEGIVTKKMQSWVDRIKDVGNDANHELSNVDSETALDVATFTQQLLILAYEMDALMDEKDPSDPPEGLRI